MTDEAVKTRTVGARRTATRRKVVDAALELWSTRGFATTTLQQVADAAGVPHPCTVARGSGLTSQGAVRGTPRPHALPGVR